MLQTDRQTDRHTKPLIGPSFFQKGWSKRMVKNGKLKKFFIHNILLKIEEKKFSYKKIGN